MAAPPVSSPSAGPTCPSAVPGQTATGAALARLCRRFSRTAGLVALLCLGIALLLTALDGGGFGTNIVYSGLIGAACLTVTELTRLAAAWLIDRLRAGRGLPPDASGFGNGWRGVVPAVILAVLLGPASGIWLADLITGRTSPSLLQFSSGSTRFTLTLSVLATGIAVFVLSTMERLASARAQAEAAQRLAAETQLALLLSQLEPHMLFNTLANLRVLIGLDPPRAQAMLDRLIAFLRTTLKASRQGEHALAAEFEHLADYLALMSMRMGPRLAVHFDLDPGLRGLPVPPLLLQPLVENAIKHGLEPRVEGGCIEVAARCDGSLLQLTVRDTGVGLADAGVAAGSTFGLAQVRARLAALYGDRASLVLHAAQDGQGGVLATVLLPIAVPGKRPSTSPDPAPATPARPPGPADRREPA